MKTKRWIETFSSPVLFIDFQIAQQQQHQLPSQMIFPHWNETLKNFQMNKKNWLRKRLTSEWTRTKKMLVFWQCRISSFFSITKHVLELYQWKNKLLAIYFAFLRWGQLFELQLFKLQVFELQLSGLHLAKLQLFELPLLELQLFNVQLLK